MEKWKRKDYYNTMEIIVSNFRLDGSESGDVWGGGGEGKPILSLLMFGKKGKTFPSKSD